MIKPQLADNYTPDKQVLPVWGQGKIDGVRGLHLNGTFTGRSLKSFKNKALSAMLSNLKYAGLDGEMACGDQTSPSLCRDTTGALGRIKGEATGFTWHVFDYVTEVTIHLPYEARYNLLRNRVATLGDSLIALVPYTLLTTMEEVEAFDASNLAAGYEGSILRNPNAIYKPGRPGSKVQELMRIKRFTDSEATVNAIEEGRNNNNEAMTNELGRTERSSHAENQVPSGMVGRLLCTDLVTGQPITVSPGAMTHDERVYYLAHPEELVGKVVKYRHFQHGAKDAPRFANFLSIRLLEDMSSDTP